MMFLFSDPPGNTGVANYNLYHIDSFLRQRNPTIVNIKIGTDMIDDSFSQDF